MKSLLISSDYFPPQIGGISQLMSGIASALGPERVCCLTGQRAQRAVRGDESGIRVYRRPAVFHAEPRFVRGAAWGATIAEIMLRDRPSVAQLATAGEGALGLWLRRWFGLPFIVYAHGNEVLNAMAPGGEKFKAGLQQADRVLAVSGFTAGLVGKIGISAERIEIVHPGCDSERFRPRRVKPEFKRKLLGDRLRHKVILTIGNLVARKGHAMVIRALAQLRAQLPDTTYVIVGDGPCRSELENLAVSLGVRGQVVFAGRIAEDLADIYALADVFAMPSCANLPDCDVEGFGLVFLEASACAKPVIGGRSGGIPDAVIDGVTGLLVNPHDVNDIAQALARIFTDDEFAARLGQQGRSYVMEHFTWRGVGERVQRILDSVLQENLHRAIYREGNSFQRT